MTDKLLLRWVEPKGARMSLARQSAGMTRILFSDMLVEGAPVLLILLTVWTFALVAGAPVMTWWRALLLSAGFAIAVATLRWALIFVNRAICISIGHVSVGSRRWRNRSIRHWSWESHQVCGTDCTVLRLQLNNSAFIRVALAPETTIESVEQALIAAGLVRA